MPAPRSARPAASPSWSGKGKERHPVEFVIDHNLHVLQPLRGGLPFDAITMWTGNFEIGAFNRRGLVFDQTAATAEVLSTP
jgi:hypothetical protein